MDLVEYEDLMRRLREKRQSLGLQQKEVAHQVGIDPGHLSKMERHFQDANYRTVYDVWQVIDREASSDHDTAGERMVSPIEWAETDETHREVKRKMTEGNFSQLPVRNEDGNHVGRITETILMDNHELERPVSELMGPELSKVPYHRNGDAVREILSDNEPALLVMQDAAPVGIVTKADFI